ncbi:phage holin family protein [Aeromicrobium sp. HA]|uniref:phage holin family protein n=1 Tax=Aeromicrobium sp. HA TaxID=3009077 RepID=UPI0022AE86DB|nr:phage holin family protein [Aeromicrobium sp. HA]
MIRLLIRAAINLVSAAIGLLVANAVLDDLEVTASGFVLTVVIFTLAQAILAPFILVVVKRNAEAFLGGVGIVSTLVALWVASLFGDALTISGLATWLIAAVIVWLAAALASFLLPFILVKAGVENARERRGA